MPGSPPSSTTPPATNPPPSTRSNSSRPEAIRRLSFVSTAESDVTTDLGPATLSKRVPADAASDSTSVFHAPHCGHCPCHFGLWPPHSVHWKTVFVLATARSRLVQAVKKLDRPLPAVTLSHRHCNSAGYATAVPSLPTTTPAASLAMRIASAAGAPAAISVPSVAMPVSPAPESA